ncbi:hypothetical protein M433DRAFT_474330 [Acidomyces richmondensis BFW]|nr:hypothetical protein M433DRAFT_474330 [Acidomyces richmondensis BFW]
MPTSQWACRTGRAKGQTKNQMARHRWGRRCQLACRLCLGDRANRGVHVDGAGYRHFGLAFGMGRAVGHRCRTAGDGHGLRIPNGLRRHGAVFLSLGEVLAMEVVGLGGRD